MVSGLIVFTVADLGGASGAHPPMAEKFSQFPAVFRKIWQNHMLAPPGGLAPPPTGNPGSAPGLHHNLIELELKLMKINLSMFLPYKSKSQQIDRYCPFAFITRSQPCHSFNME